MEVFTTMTTNRKNELIAQLVSILSELIETNDSEQVTEVTSNAVEVLTIKECTEAVKGGCQSILSASSSPRVSSRT